MAEVWTTTRVLSWTADYLGRRGDEHPRLSAEWLLSAATGLSRVELYTNYDRPLAPGELAAMHAAVARRAAGEPLQYVTGEMPFRHIVLRCEPGVLIPRPETEVLVGAALEGVDAWCARAGASADAGDGVGAAGGPASLAGLGEAPVAADGLPGVGAGGWAAAGAGTGADGDGASGKAPAPPLPTACERAAVGDRAAGVRAAGEPGGAESACAVSDDVGSALGESTAGAGTNGLPVPPRIAAGASGTGAGSDGSAVSAHIAVGAAPAAGGAGGWARVLEVGTGTGCVACSIAGERAATVVLATDVSPAAVALARRNVDALGLAARVDVAACDLAAAVPPALMGSFAVLVSNPPYIPSAVVPELPAEVAAFEPRLALDGGADGLDVFRRLLVLAPRALASGGWLCVELFEENVHTAAELTRAAGGWARVEVRDDLTRRPRVLVAVRE